MTGRLAGLTRLVPERKDDQEPTPRWVGIVIALVFAVILVFVGVLIGRGTSPEKVTTAAPSSVTRNSDGTTTQTSGNGPTTWLTNIAVNYPVGVGYSHTAPGAVAAAEHYTGYLSGQAMLSQPYRNNLLSAIVSASKRDALVQQYDVVMTADNNPLVKLVTSGTPVFVRTAPLGWRIVSYTPDAAQVSVWMNNVSGAVTGFAPTADYRTATIDLVWEDGDWKLANAQVANGPTPAPSTGDYATVEQFYPFTQNYSDPMVAQLNKEEE